MKNGRLTSILSGVPINLIFSNFNFEAYYKHIKARVKVDLFSNLTSAAVCGDRTSGKLAAKRLACVAPEVDLRECTLHLPLQCE